MNLEHFRYIIEVAEQGSISKAAQCLFLSQPYLSKVIKEVEVELDFFLFVRTNRGITLTSEGKKFIEKAKIILEQYKRLQSIEVENVNDKNKFTITTVHSSLVMESFIYLMKKYDHHDEIEFKIKETDSQTPIQDVAYLDSDLGIIYTEDVFKPTLLEELTRRNIIYQKICDFNACIILGIHHPLVQKNNTITLSDLSDYGFVTYPKSFLPYMASEKSFDSELMISHNGKKLYVNNRASLHNILTQTDYFSIGTQAARDQEKMFNITSIPFPKSDSTFALEMGVLYRDNESLNPIAHEFIERLQRNYGNHEDPY